MKKKKIEEEHNKEVAFHKVSFQYAEDKKEEEEPSKSEETPPSFVPPFPLPTEITPPSTEKQHQIILKTATFAMSQGEKAELTLKLKQLHNPNFGFLQDNHPLHPYYVFLKKNHELIESWIELQDKSEKIKELEDAQVNIDNKSDDKNSTKIVSKEETKKAVRLAKAKLMMALLEKD